MHCVWYISVEVMVTVTHIKVFIQLSCLDYGMGVVAKC